MITRVLLDLDAFYLEQRLCGDLAGNAKGERAWRACGACGRADRAAGGHAAIVVTD